MYIGKRVFMLGIVYNPRYTPIRSQDIMLYNILYLIRYTNNAQNPWRVEKIGLTFM